MGHRPLAVFVGAGHDYELLPPEAAIDPSEDEVSRRLVARRPTSVALRCGKHLTHVFSFRGRPIIQVNTKAWYAGLERAGIQDFRWHGLRHTWASWHVQNGTPLYALQELRGWASTEMVRRYAHLAADHLAPYAERLCAGRAVESSDHGTFTAQA